MNSNCPSITGCKMFVSNFHKLIYNMIWWSRPIYKKQLIVLYVVIQKSVLIVFLFIQSYYSRNIEFLKYFYVFDRMVSVPLVSVSFVNRTHKGHKFSGNNPIYITIFNPFVKFIFFHVKIFIVVPLKLHCVLNTLKTLQKRAIVKTITFRGISIWLKQGLVWLEHIISFLSWAL